MLDSFFLGFYLLILSGTQDGMSDTEELDQQDQVSFDNKWEYIGYHKVLGGFYYQVIFFALGIVYICTAD